VTLIENKNFQAARTELQRVAAAAPFDYVTRMSWGLRTNRSACFMRRWISFRRLAGWRLKRSNASRLLSGLVRDCDGAHFACAIVFESLVQLVFGIHHEGAVARYRLVDRLAASNSNSAPVELENSWHRHHCQCRQMKFGDASAADFDLTGYNVEHRVEVLRQFCTCFAPAASRK